ncbi:MAG: hypothetical protein COW71_13600 [Ignavibacteriales bacterium CG18_big_fil_WC_8_21_14_2_50_31_20]|nr:MAG: hypothetical protein COW71_13600 [Ignavibacteriales bacterium CG18_big_fil_WC_8_21_14_2_50_31_20]
MKLEIFKVGKHTSSNGLTKDYTLDDLNSIILNHTEPTPIVVGHPKTNSPAFGWIKNLFIKGESLFAEASDLVPEFLDLVKQKIYKNRSVSLSQLEDGTLALNHVGFLGGALPAVKGLEELNLNADDVAQIIHEFSLNVELDDTEETVSPFSRGTEGGSRGTEGDSEAQTKKEETFSLEQFNSLKSDVAKIVEFMESYPVQNVQVVPSELQAKIDELNLKIDLAYFQKNIVEKLQLESLTPAIKNKIIAILNYFQTLDFAQEQQTKIVSDFQELADLIQPFQTEEILKKVVKVSPFSRGTEGGSGGSEFDLMNVDKESMQLFNDATQLSEEESISFNEALNILINKKGEV